MTDLPWHRSGSGEPVVLIHGFTGSWHLWQPVIDRLESSYDVTALGLPGHLDWPWPNETEPAIDAMTDLVERRLDELGLERAHLVGNSLGGWQSLLLANRGRALSVTAFSPAGGWTDPGISALTHKLFHAMRDFITEAMPTAAETLADPATRQQVFSIVFEHGDRVPPDAALQIWQAALAVDILDHVETVFATTLPPIVTDVPLDIVWCGEDKLLPVDTTTEGWRIAAPSARWSTLDGAGHSPMYDDPDGMVAAIESTIARARNEENADG